MTLYFDVFARDDVNGDALGELSTAYDKEFTSVHQAMGSGQFTINRHDPAYAWCVTDNLVRVRREDGGPFDFDDPRYVGAFWIEEGNDVLLSSDEEGGEEVTRGGRTVEACLRWAILYPDAFDSRNDQFTTKTRKTGNWVIKDRTAGEVFAIFIRDVNDRTPDPLPFVSKDFGVTLDSDGNTWSDADTKWLFPVGTNLLDDMSTLVSGGLNYRVGADVQFHAYEDEPGDDLTGTIEFAHGVNIYEAADRLIHARSAVSRALVQGTTEDGELKYREVVDTDVEDAIGRREGFVEFQRTPTNAKLTRAGNRFIRKQKKRHDGPTTANVREDEWTAFDDYVAGDVVSLHIPGEFSHRATRINAITLAEDEAGNDVVTLTFEEQPFDPATNTDKGEFADGSHGGGGSCADCPPLPPHTPGGTTVDADCETVLAGVTSATDGPHSPPSSGAGSVALSGAGVVLALAAANNDNVPGATDITSSWTEIFEGGVPSRSPRTLAAYQVGGGTLAYSWTPGFGSVNNEYWGAVAAMLPTSATAPIQSVSGISPGSTGLDLTFPSPPQEGNLMVAFLAKRSATSHDPSWPAGELLVAADGFVSLADLPNIGGQGIGIFAKCVELGDGDTYGSAGDEVILTLQEWAMTATAVDDPAEGQQHNEEFTGDGSTTAFQTGYPYAPGSLHVWVNGVAVVPDETDPTTGDFTLPFAPATGSKIVIEYQNAGTDATGGGGIVPTTGGGIVPATQVSIVDAGNFYTGTDVEAALQEIAGGSGTPPALDDLSDVTAPTPADGDLLAFDSGSGEWVNVAPVAPAAPSAWVPVMVLATNLVTTDGSPVWVPLTTSEGEAVMAETTP